MACHLPPTNSLCAECFSVLAIAPFVRIIKSSSDGTLPAGWPIPNSDQEFSYKWGPN